MKTIFKNLKEKTTIVHCITNYVTVNDLANIVLASGASPIMADDREEVEEIVSIANSLLINIGTLNARTVESMVVAGTRANELGIPVVLDPVGVGASSLRQDTVEKLLDKVSFALIKGNASEIKFLYNREASKSGVDVSVDDIISEENISSYIDMAKSISNRYRTLVAITGPIDLVVSGDEAYTISNGNSYMEDITGTGCMLGALLAGLIGANPDRKLEATVLGVTLMGLAGDYAKKYTDRMELGRSSFRTSLIDEIGLIDYKNIEEDGRFEKR